MSEVFEDVEEKPVETSWEETQTVAKLFEYTKEKYNPWWKDYCDIVEQCHNMVELRHWEKGSDKERLANLGVTPLAVDRVNRGLDNIKGKKTNSRLKKKVSHRETGDKRIAMLLDKAVDQVAYVRKFDKISDSAFDSMLKIGEGVRKTGWDNTSSGGMGDIVDQFVNREDFRCSQTFTDDLSDITWAWDVSMMDWTQAIQLAPEKASQIMGLKETMMSEWSLLNSGSSNGIDYDKDYWSKNGAGKYAYPDQVRVHEFWIQRVVPVTKVMSITVTPEGQMAPQMRAEAGDYQAQEGEQTLSTTLEEWWQFVVVGGERNGLLAKAGKADEHPYTGMCAERKKSGMPFGYVEIVTPHQQRVDIAWAQKSASNNFALKHPLVFSGNVTPDVIEANTHQSRFGPILIIPQGVNLLPNPSSQMVDLQAIEEGQSARADMDLAGAATEEPLRGISPIGDSGAKLSLQQDAATTSLNKWTKAYQNSMLTFYRKILKIIVLNYKPERLARIVGQEMFMKIAGVQLDPMTGQVIAPPLEWPLQIDLVEYDIVIEDQSISDFQKQQSFNATSALIQMGFGMDAEYVIMNSPINNPEEALASHMRWRQDQMRAMMAYIEQLEAEIKAAPKEGGKQDPKAQGSKGKNASQAGQRSMVGGQGTKSPLGMGQ